MAKSLRKLICSQCGKEFIYKDRALLPFCSKRCKMIDLGHWLSEKYVVEERPPKKTNEEDN